VQATSAVEPSTDAGLVQQRFDAAFAPFKAILDEVGGPRWEEYAAVANDYLNFVHNKGCTTGVRFFSSTFYYLRSFLRICQNAEHDAQSNPKALCLLVNLIAQRDDLNPFLSTMLRMTGRYTNIVAALDAIPAKTSRLKIEELKRDSTIRRAELAAELPEGTIKRGLDYVIRRKKEAQDTIESKNSSINDKQRQCGTLREKNAINLAKVTELYEIDPQEIEDAYQWVSQVQTLEDMESQNNAEIERIQTEIHNLEKDIADTTDDCTRLLNENADVVTVMSALFGSASGGDDEGDSARQKRIDKFLQDYMDSTKRVDALKSELAVENENSDLCNMIIRADEHVRNIPKFVEDFVDLWTSHCDQKSAIFAYIFNNYQRQLREILCLEMIGGSVFLSEILSSYFSGQDFALRQLVPYIYDAVKMNPSSRAHLTSLQGFGNFADVDSIKALADLFYPGNAPAFLDSFSKFANNGLDTQVKALVYGIFQKIYNSKDYRDEGKDELQYIFNKSKISLATLVLEQWDNSVPHDDEASSLQENVDARLNHWKTEMKSALFGIIKAGITPKDYAKVQRFVSILGQNVNASGWNVFSEIQDYFRDHITTADLPNVTKSLLTLFINFGNINHSPEGTGCVNYSLLNMFFAIESEVSNSEYILNMEYCSAQDAARNLGIFSGLCSVPLSVRGVRRVIGNTMNFVLGFNYVPRDRLSESGRIMASFLDSLMK
jgi:hypothetical protein